MSINDNTVPLSLDSQHANRHALAVQDMMEVQQYLETYSKIAQLMTVDNQRSIEVACQGMLSAAIVAYCRPFLSSRSTGFATRSVDASDLKTVGARQALHDLLIQKRNKFIAHADWSARRAEVVISGTTDIHVAYTEPDVAEGLDLQQFNILAYGVYMECLSKTLAHGMAAQQAETPAV
jgi:hypothetical protein